VINGGKTVMGADRDASGRFLPGRPGGPGRPRRVTAGDHLAALSEAVTPEVRQDIIAPASDQASDGDRFRAVSQGAGPCEASTHNGPPVRFDPAPVVIPEVAVESRPAAPLAEIKSRAPSVAGPLILAEWQGAPLDGSWRVAIARLPIAWRHRWETRAEARQAAGWPKHLAEFMAYREVLEETTV
jgi:hypothetical protein